MQPTGTPEQRKPSWPAPEARPTPIPGTLTAARAAWGLALAVALPVLLTVALNVVGGWVGLPVQSLLFLLVLIITTVIGGLWPGLLCALVGTTLLNYFFIPPLHTLRVGEIHNVLTLVVFLLVGVLVGAVVHRAAAMSMRAASGSAQARTLAAIAGGAGGGHAALPTLLEQVRVAFGMTSASILREAVHVDDETTTTPAIGHPDWVVEQCCGTQPPERPEEADVQAPIGPNRVLALAGRSLATGDRTILNAFTTQAHALLERQRLQDSADRAEQLQATDRLRNALLAALGHDLRTPLASASAAVGSLRSTDVRWSPEETVELLATADESLQRLGRLVADLLDLSRVTAGALVAAAEPVWLSDLVPPALDELGPPAAEVKVEVPDTLDPVRGDPALITRALVNVLGNALRYSPQGRPPEVTACTRGATVQLMVSDHGPGIPARDRERVFTPFQRLGDTDRSAGLGLGLALSRGLLEAMGGRLIPEDTAGGGLTMVLSLPAAYPMDPQRAPEPGRRERD